MANEEWNAALKKIESRADAWARLDPVVATRKESLGDLGFTDALPTLSAVKVLGTRLQSIVDRIGTHPGFVPMQILTPLINSTSTLENTLGQLTTFNPATPQQLAGRPQYMINLDAALGSVGPALANILALLPPDERAQEAATAAEDAKRRAEEAARAVDEVMKAAEKNANDGAEAVNKSAEEKLREIEGIAVAARAGAAKTGVAAHEGDFRTAVTDSNKAAGKWLAASIFVGVAIAVFLTVAIIIYPLDPSAKNGDIAHYVLVRLGSILVLFYFLVWCTRNHRSHRHIAVMNEHRANALHTYETFAASTDDAAAKQAILLESARCIFTPPPSGYAGSGEDEGSPTRIIEVLKSLGGKDK